jgi:hypothetical protein
VLVEWAAIISTGVKRRVTQGNLPDSFPINPAFLWKCTVSCPTRFPVAV